MKKNIWQRIKCFFGFHDRHEEDSKVGYQHLTDDDLIRYYNDCRCCGKRIYYYK